jgi:hypothetical protein
VVVAMGLMVLLLTGLYMFFASGSRQTASGEEMLEKFHRLRVVTEVMKDDVREAEEILTPAGDYGNSLTFIKFGGLMELDGQKVTPRLKKVHYEFFPDEKKFVSTYGDKEELFNTPLFEDVKFKVYFFMGRAFVRMKLTIINDKHPDALPTVIYHSVGSRHLSSYISQKYWYSLPETKGILQSN